MIFFQNKDVMYALVTEGAVPDGLPMDQAIVSLQEKTVPDVRRAGDSHACGFAPGEGAPWQ